MHAGHHQMACLLPMARADSTTKHYKNLCLAAESTMNEVISDIYQAATGHTAWSVVLTRISSDLGLLGCQMIGVSTEHGSVLFSHASDGSPGTVELDYVRKYHLVDPRVPLVLGGASGVWVFDQDVFEPEFLASNSFYADLLVPCGGQFSASSKLVEQRGEAILLACLSRSGDVGFDGHRREYLASIAFHLSEGAAIYLQGRRHAVHATAGTEMLQRMSRPAMLLGLDRHVSFMNAAATRFVSETNILALPGDRLFALQCGNDVKLALLFEAIARDIEEKSALGSELLRHALRLGRRQGPAEVVLSLTPFAPSQCMYAFGMVPLVLVIVHAYGATVAPDLMLWEVAYDLTPAQARVGLALYQGRTVNQAAAELQVSRTTVKSHLRELFRKTRTSGQVELAVALGALQG